MENLTLGLNTQIVFVASPSSIRNPQRREKKVLTVFARSTLVTSNIRAPKVTKEYGLVVKLKREMLQAVLKEHVLSQNGLMRMQRNTSLISH